MAIPVILGTLYRTLGSYGYKAAKAIRPSKIKKALTGSNKIKKDGFDKYRTMKKLRTKSEILLGVPKTEKIIKGTTGLGKKAYEGYRKAYASTLGTSTRRKVTSGTVGGYTLGSFLAGDDIE